MEMCSMYFLGALRPKRTQKYISRLSAAYSIRGTAILLPRAYKISGSLGARFLSCHALDLEPDSHI